MPVLTLWMQLRNIAFAVAALVMWCVATSTLLDVAPKSFDASFILPDLTASLQLFQGWIETYHVYLPRYFWIVVGLCLAPFVDELVLLALPFLVVMRIRKWPTFTDAGAIIAVSVVLVALAHGTPASLLVQGGARVILGVLFLANARTAFSGAASAFLAHALYNFLLSLP